MEGWSRNFDTPVDVEGDGTTVKQLAELISYETHFFELSTDYPIVAVYIKTEITIKNLLVRQ